ncbi:MAG: hypothetical protein M0P71_16245 [Melioribacteraceae bacterium]|jgi:soluble lytic murein transglycosylase-like protein|nr:hypothetical protein [Melioribacteraceae bacterium]
MNKEFLQFVIFVSVLYLLLSNKNLAKSFSSGVINLDDSDTGKIYNRYYTQISNIVSAYSLQVDTAMILSVINQETGTLFNNKTNNNITGDNGSAVGYMQIRQPALTDVNKNFGTNYLFSDLYGETINLIVGSLYLELCYRSALNNNSQNPVWLAFKKYNGGIDETDLSKNSMANTYANNVYSLYQNYKGVV